MREIEARNFFDSSQLRTVTQAVSLAEDVISDWYHLTISSWKKYRYDIRVQNELTEDEIAPLVFAQIRRYARPALRDGMRHTDFYRICLQDHNILAALSRDRTLNLLPLMTYVVTHELIHIVRFYKFFQFFDADDHERTAEEVRVHTLTHQLLQRSGISGMEQIFDFYADHRKNT